MKIGFTHKDSAQPQKYFVLTSALNGRVISSTLNKERATDLADEVVERIKSYYKDEKNALTHRILLDIA